ncbi:MAG: lytic transglycosylase domain-containing protein [Alphaproteobacteria bacterium]|nr:MAG: lytic transglycosylase domain-containing protein [Alphaproteobacteria bacterium]
MIRGRATLLAMLAILAPPPATGEGALPGAGGFTFKRVPAPPPGQGPRIDVQIDPDDYAAWMAGKGDAAEAGAVADAPGDSAPGAGPDEAGQDDPWAWFWDEVSPEAEKGGPANLQRALAALAQHGAPAPRLAALQAIAARHGRAILAATVGTRVSPALVLALIAVESSGRAGAESPKGAQGLMQLVPATAARFGVADATDAAQNIAGGVAYLSWLLEQFGGDVILALAGYNAGENAVKAAGGVPGFPETRAYVPKVLSAWRVARGLCRTPPELITDGCVFAVRAEGEGAGGQGAGGQG